MQLLKTLLYHILILNCHHKNVAGEKESPKAYLLPLKYFHIPIYLRPIFEYGQMQNHALCGTLLGDGLMK